MFLRATTGTTTVTNRSIILYKEQCLCSNNVFCKKLSFLDSFWFWITISCSRSVALDKANGSFSFPLTFRPSLTLPGWTSFLAPRLYLQCFHFAGNFLISGNPDLKRKFSGWVKISGNLMKSQENQEISKNLMTSIKFYLFNVNFLNSCI